MRMWGGRFGDEPDARMADFTRSIEVDAELALDDIAGSIAHVRGLGRAGLLTDDEVATLEGGLEALRRGRRGRRDRLGPDARGRPPQPRDGARGAGRARSAASSTPAARATTRSRRTSGCGRAAPSDRLDAAIVGLERALVGLAERDGDAVLPGLHPHPARPAGAARPPPARLRRDARARSRPARGRARAGSTSRRWAPGRSPAPGYPLDREATAAELGFDGVTRQLARRGLATATSSSSCWPPRPSRWSTSAASPRRSPGGRTRASGSCASPTRSRPARR